MKNYPKISHFLICTYALAAGLSIAVSQIAVISFILLTTFQFFNTKRDNDADRYWLYIFSVPLGFWLLLNYCSTVVGVDPRNAISEVLKTSLYLTFPFCLYYCFEKTSKEKFLCNLRTYIYLMVVGLALASLHTVLETAFEIKFKPSPPGEVTESGQLALVLPFLVCMLFEKFTNGTKNKLEKTAVVFNLSLFAILIILFSWPQTISFGISETSLQITIFALLITSPFFLLFPFQKKQKFVTFVSVLLLSILFACLIVNLKRGPWISVFTSLLLIGLMLSRTLFLSTILGSGFIIALIEPARIRLFNFLNDFLISGGRGEMWQIGGEIAQRYPMGLGPDNARYMHDFDLTLPESHQHMHSNLLNILVESGWLGLVSYLWWILVIISISFSLWNYLKDKKEFLSFAYLSLGIGISMISWQIAGIVEYNFGDGEVRLIALFFIGTLLAITKLCKLPVPGVR